MDRFERILKNTILPNEALYSNDAADPGGQTVWGISRVHWPQWEGWTIVDAAKSQPSFPLSLNTNPALDSRVADFYRKRFWNPLYEQLKSERIAEELMDFGVNQGMDSAVKTFQKSLRSLLAGPVVVDGNFGPKTLEFANAVAERDLWNEFIAREAVEYTIDSINRTLRYLKERIAIPEQVLKDAREYGQKYALGWMRRVMR